MEHRRVKLREPEGETVTLELWCEYSETGTLIIIKHFSFYGEWLDAEGDTYPFALRFDGVLDYGAWSEDDSKGSHLLVHGRALSLSSCFPYRSRSYECNFTVSGIFDGSAWQEWGISR